MPSIDNFRGGTGVRPSGYDDIRIIGPFQGSSIPIFGQSKFMGKG